MYKYRKIISIVAAMLILFGALGFANPDKAKAWEPGFYEFDIPTLKCSDLDTMSLVVYPYLAGITSPFGFKIEKDLDIGESYTGTYYFTSSYGTLTGGAPSDPSNYVTITQLTNYSFDWLASLGIDAVIVKAQDERVYVYDPEQFTGTNLSTIGEKGISHIEFCYDYELDAVKTANAEFTRTYEWEITKDYDGTYNLLAGGSVDHDYLVTVDKTVYKDSDFKVTGTITITNNTPFDDVAYTVTDKVGTIDAEVTCPQPQELGSGDFAVCTYTADLTEKADGTNTATISTTHGFVGGEIATADYVFGDPTKEVNATINVTDTNGKAWSATDDDSWPYSKKFECSTDPDDYTDGFYTYDHINTAKITETGQYDIATVTVNCTLDPLVPTKTAEGSYDRTVTWELEKTVDPASHIGFAGEEAGSSTWTVKATKTEVSDNYKVVGTISVYNPAAIPQTFTVEDYLDDGSKATVDCPSLTVEPKATLNCTYEADATAKATENTVKVTARGNNPQFGYAKFTYKENLIGYDSGNLIDERFDFEKVISGTTTETFPESFICPSDPKLYEGNGVYSFKEVNEATLNGNIGLEDSAEVNVTCYAPVVSKTAFASYDETHTWDIEKSAGVPVSGYPGDTLNWTWKVNVSESSANSNFKVVGEITIHNPSLAEMTVSIVDQLDDGTSAVVDCGEDVDETAVLVPAGATVTCSYEAKPEGKTATENKATVTFNKLLFTAYADVNFVANVIDGTATVTDDQIGLNELITAGDGPWEFSGSGSHVCSSDASAYGADGQYGETLYNTAVVTGSDGQIDSDDASTSYLCEAGFVDLLKHTNGAIDATKDWKFALYLGPDGFGTTPIANDSTLNDTDGVLDFGGPALRPDKTYTICELSVPAGYTTFWQINGTTVIPYNPNANDPTPEVLGNYCVDFIPTVVGETVHFYVDNQEGGGDPRTPGYWKNWNTCTGGGQAATADANGGWEEGFWLLDDVLGLTDAVTDGITWDDILADEFLFPINSCDLAVSILNTKDFNSGKVLASDPGYNLAKHLLAAQLNFGAGACKPAFDVLGDKNIDEVALDAETLLDKYDFDAVGEGISKKKKDDAALALQLATILDKYNNGLYCGSTYGP